MLRSIKFKNFRALRNTVLPLEPFTLIMGPNGSGKSTALQGLKMACAQSDVNANVPSIATVGVDLAIERPIEIILEWATTNTKVYTAVSWSKNGKFSRNTYQDLTETSKKINGDKFQRRLSQVRIYSLEAAAIAEPVHIQPNIEISANGKNVPAVLDRLKDQEPERFEALVAEFVRWLPDYDSITFDVPEPGKKTFCWRTRKGKHRIPANQLSQGTLLAFAILTMAYLPDPPDIIGLEEPDRGIHPRLLRDLRDALYRLSYPDIFGESRKPVQVIITSHSPYLMDLFRDHPEEIVLAEKTGLDVDFRRLSELPHFEEILGDAMLSEVWYTGIFGGVPTTAS